MFINDDFKNKIVNFYLLNKTIFPSNNNNNNNILI